MLQKHLEQIAANLSTTKAIFGSVLGRLNFIDGEAEREQKKVQNNPSPASSPDVKNGNLEAKLVRISEETAIMLDGVKFLDDRLAKITEGM